MNKATEELQRATKGILHQYIIRNLDETITISEDWITNQILKLLKDMGYKREVEKRLPMRFLHPDDKPNTSYETAKQDMLNWHNASLEEIDIE